MRKFGLLTFLTSALFLAGCQTVPSIITHEPPVCPVVEPAPVCEVCVVCEVQQCPTLEIVEPLVAECPPSAEQVQISSATVEEGYPSIGEKEWALIEPGDLILEARIDTGAETSSIHAEDILLIEKDGKRWIRFSLTDPKTNENISLERRLHRRIMVKQKNSDVNEPRYVVRMWVTLGDTRIWLDVSLTDRDDFEFPLLIGRNMLIDNFAVDVSKHHTLPKPVAEVTEDK